MAGDILLRRRSVRGRSEALLGWSRDTVREWARAVEVEIIPDDAPREVKVPVTHRATKSRRDPRTFGLPGLPMDSLGLIRPFAPYRGG